eukprot:6466581-Amphidinium_carterae.1
MLLQKAAEQRMMQAVQPVLSEAGVRSLVAAESGRCASAAIKANSIKQLQQTVLAALERQGRERDALALRELMRSGSEREVDQSVQQSAQPGVQHAQNLGGVGQDDQQRAHPHVQPAQNLGSPGSASSDQQHHDEERLELQRSIQWLVAHMRNLGAAITHLKEEQGKQNACIVKLVEKVTQHEEKEQPSDNGQQSKQLVDELKMVKDQMNTLQAKMTSVTDTVDEIAEGRSVMEISRLGKGCTYDKYDIITDITIINDRLTHLEGWAQSDHSALTLPPCVSHATGYPLNAQLVGAGESVSESVDALCTSQRSYTDLSAEARSAQMEDPLQHAGAQDAEVLIVHPSPP